MRIVTWNCNGALRKKLQALESLQADVFVIQECEDPARSPDAAYRAWASNHLWVGTNKNKGLGVFARPGLQLQAASLDSGGLELFLPCVVAKHISLLAVWTREAGSPTFGYIGQLWKYLQRNAAFLSADHSALIGDLNSNARWDLWDRWWNHSDVVRQLDGMGLQSLYHLGRGEAQGEETTPTFYMYRHPEKGHHIDYAFLSEGLRQGASLDIGEQDAWLEFSDHLPLLIQLDSVLNA